MARTPLALSGIFLLSSLVNASTITTFTDRAAFDSNDSVDWGSLGTAGTVLSNPFSVQSAGGLGITGLCLETPLSRFRCGPKLLGQSSAFQADFATGDNLLFVAHSEVYDAELTFTFASPIFGLGSQIEGDLTPFTIDLSVYNGDTLLNNFSESRASTTVDSSAPFIGILDSVGEITKAVFRLENRTPQPQNMILGSLAINRPVAVPEPDGWLALCLELCMIPLFALFLSRSKVTSGKRDSAAG